VNQRTAKTEIACYGGLSASRVRVRTVKTVTKAVAVEVKIGKSDKHR